MYFALIKNNKVESIIVADEDFVTSLQGYDSIVNVDGVEVGVGWEYVNKEFKRPVVPEVLTKISRISMKQLRLGLLKAGKLSLVPTAITNLPSPDKEEVEIGWQYDTQVYRDGFINKLAPGLSMSSFDIDTLFVESSTL